MSPHYPTRPETASGAPEAVYRPRESDGVGHALRRVFAKADHLPGDLDSLIARLDRID